MDLSLLNDEAMDDSFLVIRPEAMDDEVTQIFKKWKLNNPLPKKDIENLHTHVANTHSSNETQFDSRTFTRPLKRRTFNLPVLPDLPSSSSTIIGSDGQSIESGIASINLQIGGAFTPMQRSWLKDVSPPSSICTSMDFQNNDTMLNSLVTSSDFTNVSFLLNGSLHENANFNEMPKRAANNTITLSSGKSNSNNNQTVTLNPNATQNLMDFTFDVHDKTLTNEPITNGNTFVTDSEPMKEFGIENADIQLNESTEDVGKNLTFNKYDCNITWDKIQNQDLNKTIVQSTPLQKVDMNSKPNDFDETLSPISSLHAQIIDDDDDDGELILRSVKSKRLLNLMDDYRNSMEDQCEFLLNEETIKLSSRVCGDSFERLDDIKSSLITSAADVNEKEFDEMLDSKFNVTKSKEGEKLLQSVDNIKQRHSLINMEKQREEKHKRDSENDNRIQYDVMNKSSERLLNRRSRLFDDVNLQVQKQQQIETSNLNGSASSSSSTTTQFNKTHNLESAVNDAENDEIVDKNDRDRFKTIKLNRPRLQTGMVVIDTDEITDQSNEVSPGSNKERRNQLNQQKQEEESVEFKKPTPAVSRLSKFGFSRPTYRPRNELNLPLKANSTDSLDNDSESSIQPTSNLKSPMGIKSKSIHNLIFNGGNNGIRMTSNLKYNTETKSQSNLKAPRASSLVRQSVDTNFKLPQSNQSRVLPVNKKGPGLVRPSSGYYGNAKRLDSDNESYSLSSSSASSRNSVHLSLAPEQQQYYQPNSLQSTEDLHQPVIQQQKAYYGAVSKSSGISRPMSGLPRPQTNALKSGLPRPRR
ncbi:hypothetical protein PVAND_004310 [Polypedilum vanderplanki]|uniref:Uncharacterized protein n=1 Tax=Polypedilum vanderplanki TaxID=319348 RepID=A0A9J6BWR4_POLVA|nr:hypothetical protein PVAND_004310 [Polypedilum vanderplanki]